jgi:ParB/RepB/Spo0J family partition protein
MEVVELAPTEVGLRVGMERFRREIGDVSALADSFTKTRQILPIVITRKNELIDGGRRLAACMMAGIKVKCVYEDVVDDYQMRELELEANLHRKDYTPAEEALAIEELHRLKQREHGESQSGSTDGWSIEDTAKLLGKSRGSVYNAMEMAALVKTFPQLKTAKKKSEIRKAGHGLQKLMAVVDGVKKHEEAIASKKELFQLIRGDAVEDILARPKGSIDILLTDPIYGIDADLLTQGVGGKTGGDFTTAGYKIEDEREASLFYYSVMAREGFRVTTNNCHGYIFVGPEHFWSTREMFLREGWRVHIKPLIWIKREVGQCNVPSAWPASCYEMIMYIRKDESRLVREGMPDWIECPPVNPSDKRHPFEKPVDLLNNLLERVALPGQTLYDPFMGSASAIEAGIKQNLFCIGVDNSSEAYANACERMAEVTKEKTDGKGKGKAT